MREYAANGSEQAFGQLVAGHIDLVYSAALRAVNGDDALAGDVAQVVFTDLARKAKSLPTGVVLSGWLYRHTCFMAANAVRAERRRQAREREAATMQALNEDKDAAWRQLAPVLEEAMTCLGTPDRDAIVLRFFEQRPLRAVGQTLGISEEAARKRVDRAIAALRTHLLRRGVTLSAAGLAAAISAEAVSAAPAGLAATLAHASLAGAASATAGAGTTLLGFLAMTKLQATTLGLLFIAGVATPILLNSQANTTAKAPATAAASAPSEPAHRLAKRSPAQAAAASNVSSALARLEAWLRKLDGSDPSWSDIIDDLHFMVWSLPTADYPRAWGLRERIRSGEILRVFQSQVLLFWSKTDPRSAATAAQSIPIDWMGNDAANMVLGHWGEQDPKAALAWAQGSLPEGLRLSRVQNVFKGMAGTDPAAALATSQQFLTPGLAMAVVAPLIDHWASRDPAAAAVAVTQMPPSPQRAAAFGILVRNWKQLDPEAAQKWLDQTSLAEDKRRDLQRKH